MATTNRISQQQDAPNRVQVQNQPNMNVPEIHQKFDKMHAELAHKISNDAGKNFNSKLENETLNQLEDHLIEQLRGINVKSTENDEKKYLNRIFSNIFHIKKKLNKIDKADENVTRSSNLGHNYVAFYSDMKSETETDVKILFQNISSDNERKNAKRKLFDLFKLSPNSYKIFKNELKVFSKNKESELGYESPSNEFSSTENIIDMIITRVFNKMTTAKNGYLEKNNYFKNLDLLEKHFPGALEQFYGSDDFDLLLAKFEGVNEADHPTLKVLSQLFKALNHINPNGGKDNLDLIHFLILSSNIDLKKQPNDLNVVINDTFGEKITSEQKDLLKKGLNQLAKMHVERGHALSGLKNPEVLSEKATEAENQLKNVVEFISKMNAALNPVVAPIQERTAVAATSPTDAPAEDPSVHSSEGASPQVPSTSPESGKLHYYQACVTSGASTSSNAATKITYKTVNKLAIKEEMKGKSRITRVAAKVSSVAKKAFKFFAEHVIPNIIHITMILRNTEGIMQIFHAVIPKELKIAIAVFEVISSIAILLITIELIEKIKEIIDEHTVSFKLGERVIKILSISAIIPILAAVLTNAIFTLKKIGRESILDKVILPAFTAFKINVIIQVRDLFLGIYVTYKTSSLIEEIAELEKKNQSSDALYEKLNELLIGRSGIVKSSLASLEVHASEEEIQERLELARAAKDLAFYRDMKNRVKVFTISSAIEVLASGVQIASIVLVFAGTAVVAAPFLGLVGEGLQFVAKYYRKYQINENFDNSIWHKNSHWDDDEILAPVI